MHSLSLRYTVIIARGNPICGLINTNYFYGSIKQLFKIKYVFFGRLSTDLSEIFMDWQIARHQFYGEGLDTPLKGQNFARTVPCSPNLTTTPRHPITLQSILPPDQISSRLVSILSRSHALQLARTSHCTTLVDPSILQSACAHAHPLQPKILSHKIIPIPRYFYPTKPILQSLPAAQCYRRGGPRDLYKTPFFFSVNASMSPTRHGTSSSSTKRLGWLEPVAF